MSRIHTPSGAAPARDEWGLRSMGEGVGEGGEGMKVQRACRVRGASRRVGEKVRGNARANTGAQPPALENEQNTAGLVATIREAGAEPRQALLWGYAKPWRFEAGGKEWYLMLRRRQWSVPFSITLEKFIHEYHPGTQVARTYESDVIKTEGGRQQEINIRMNEPLRHEGYTFFQSSFYESPPESGVFASVFAVVRNPADQWPLWGCIIITAGLLIHFGVKLGDYLRRERVRHA